jgi:hypothetical protein
MFLDDLFQEQEIPHSSRFAGFFRNDISFLLREGGEEVAIHNKSQHFRGIYL